MKKSVLRLSTTALGLIFFTLPAFAMEAEEDTNAPIRKALSLPEIRREIVKGNHKTASLVCKAWKESADSGIFSLTVLPNVKDAVKGNFLLRFPHLKSLCIGEHCNVCDEVLSNIRDEVLSKLTNLKSLNLRNNRTITNEAVSLLTNLKSLHLWENRTITDDAVSRLTNVTYLDLYRNRTITNEAVLSLTNLKSLRLEMNDTITDEAVSLLTNVTYLDLASNHKITNEAVSRLTNLTELNLFVNRRITDEALLNLPKLKALKGYCSKITKEMIAVLRKKGVDFSDY